MTLSESMNGIEVVLLISRHVILKEPQNRIKLRLHKKGLEIVNEFLRK